MSIDELLMSYAAQLAELRANNKKLKAQLKECREDMCAMCGDYITVDVGSCNDCKWNGEKE